jgi:hypothetical protein
MLDASLADFKRLCFGGTTNAFPSLKRSAAAIAIRLADDSADADLSCGVLTAASLTVGTTVKASSTVDGVLLLTNAAGTDFLKIQFGGTTAAFPSIQRFGTSLFFRLADASAFAPIQCGVINSGQIIASANIQTSGQVIATGDVTGDNHHVGSVSVMLDLTNAGMPNGAAASAGTLTNAPIAGNPTKWIPILVSGATKYIPAW